MDKIQLSGLEFYGYHGCLPEEARLGQHFVVDVVMLLSLREAGESDDLQATVNYAEVYQSIKTLVEGRPVKLIECLAEKIATRLLEKWPRLDKVQVTVHKPGAPIAGSFRDVAITIERGRA